MGEPERSLTAFGRRVAELQDRAPEARLDRERGVARLLAAGPARPPARRWTMPLAAAAAALLVAALVLVARPRAPLRFELGATEAGAVGAWIAAPPSASQPIRFSDGSRLVLGPEGRARVTAVDADGAEISLERGALEVAVVHRAHTRWTVRSGPFQVHVIGTRFEVRWDPAAEQLELALHEGAITVSGPVVGDARAVRAGERLTISAPKGRLDVGAIDGTAAPAPTTAPPAEDAGAAPGPAIAPEPGTPPPPSAARVHGTVASASAAPFPEPAKEEAPAWRALAREARYKDALATAEREGFDGICAGAGAGDLRALGDVARLGGSPARAEQAFTALRRRFPGSPEAAAAAFILGRMAQDHRKDYAGAAGWFTRYLSEQPGGDFAADAAGRLVEALDRLGDDAGARRAAERYLASYPGGAYAAYARRVLARGDGGPP